MTTSIYDYTYYMDPPTVTMSTQATPMPGHIHIWLYLLYSHTRMYHTHAGHTHLLTCEHAHTSMYGHIT